MTLDLLQKLRLAGEEEPKITIIIEHNGVRTELHSESSPFRTEIEMLSFDAGVPGFSDNRIQYYGNPWCEPSAKISWKISGELIIKSPLTVEVA